MVLSQETAKIIAKALFYSSIQASIGSVLLSSSYSVRNFSKDQSTLQRAADALKGYVIMSIVWTIATMLALYGAYGCFGALVGLAANLAMIAWIVITYFQAFKDCVKEHNLTMPSTMTTIEWIIAGGVLALATTGVYCYGEWGPVK